MKKAVVFSLAAISIMLLAEICRDLQDSFLGVRQITVDSGNITLLTEQQYNEIVGIHTSGLNAGVAKPMRNLKGTAAALDSTNGNSNEDSSVYTDTTVVGIVVTVRVGFVTGATQSATMRVYTSPNNSNFDTAVFTQFTISVSAGNQVQQSFRLGPEVKYFKVNHLNNETGSRKQASWIAAVGVTIT